MIDVNQLRRGVTFVHDGALLKVNEYSHSKPGRGKATIRVRVRDLRTGTNKMCIRDRSRSGYPSGPPVHRRCHAVEPV